MPLDYIDSTPLYIQLAKEIEKKVHEGIYTDQIPSERELMDEYRISRSTVRQCIEKLVRDGVLEKRRGKGTFIAPKPITDWLGSLKSTNETIESMGLHPGAKLTEAKIIQVDEHLKKLTGLEEAYYFSRIRYANQTPIGIEEHYFPVSLGKRLAQYDLNREAFYNLVEKELNLQTFEASQKISAEMITRKQAKLLETSMKLCMLKTERLVKDVEGNFVEYEQAFYRGDLYSFQLNLARKN
ncbi:GntR family transcriptional regulator [Allobacillus sp. GCM10007491]|uniref:GntR family transcriptional regulator n=1 Tax=Allobacillus saliphilus TaxID=2912308 RepID=A0A941CUA9_9BACI|nr:GntR family transcriptional regulator [Allobacillus saliphilus]MBR7552528.1 GntR family transcriptional regulator [Allobacillus saliphilus]